MMERWGGQSDQASDRALSRRDDRHDARADRHSAFRDQARMHTSDAVADARKDRMRSTARRDFLGKPSSVDMTRRDRGAHKRPAGAAIGHHNSDDELERLRLEIDADK